MVAGVVVQQAARASLEAIKGAQEVSKHFMGYDFIGLVTRLLVFYTIALVIAKIMELIVFAQGGLSKAAALFGIPMPTTVPEPVRKLFVEGYSIGGMTIKWWDLVKVISVLIVVSEWLSYESTLKANGQKSAPSTKAVFFMIIGALLLISIPQLAQMIKESKITDNVTSIFGGERRIR